jgi:formate dehydrogenase subunit delta
MAKSEIDHLLKMANDIAENLSFHADADERIADHINRFWAPRMRKLLIGHVASGGHVPHRKLASAVAKLR